MGDEKVKDQEIVVPDLEVIKTPEGYTEAEWLGLSDAAKEIILDEIAHPEGEAPPDLSEEVLKEVAGEEAPLKEGEAPAPKAEEKPAEKAAGEAEEGKILSDEDLLALKFDVPATIDLSKGVPIPDDIQDKIDDVEEKMGELKAKFESGEIDGDDFKSKNKEFQNQIRDLDRQAVVLFTHGQEAAGRQATQLKQQDTFLVARPEYLGIKGDDGKFKATEDSEMLMKK